MCTFDDGRVIYMVMILLLLSLLCVPACAEHAPVLDHAGVYTDQEIAEMETIINELISAYQMDIGVLTTRDVPDSQGDDSVTVRYADDFFDLNGYGMGEDRAGVLFILDMQNRYNYLSTAGTMADYLNDHRISEILDSAEESLYEGNYGEAMLAQLRKLGQFLREGIEEGQFRYDQETGRRLTGLYNKLTNAEAVVSVLAGLIVACIAYFVIQCFYLLKGKTYKYPLNADNVSVNMTKNEEQFLRETVSRSRISTDSGSGSRSGGGGGRGSSMHTSSSGISHGGGGRHF